MSEHFEFFEWPIQNNSYIRGSMHPADTTGTNVWCIMCHGFTGHRLGPNYLFVKMSRYLQSQGISTLRFDFRGSGESDGLFSSMNVETMEKDLSFVIDNLKTTRKPSKLFLFGHSFGGLVAALACKSHSPDGLILLSAVSDPPSIIERRKSQFVMAQEGSGLFQTGPHEIHISFLDTLLRSSPRECIATNFKGKLLLIHGDEDATIPFEESKKYLETAQNAGIDTQMEMFKGTDHNYSTVADTIRLNELLATWIKGAI
jgi:alpha/beta superfamily hydrolase